MNNVLKFKNINNIITFYLFSLSLYFVNAKQIVICNQVGV